MDASRTQTRPEVEVMFEEHARMKSDCCGFPSLDKVV